MPSVSLNLVWWKLLYSVRSNHHHHFPLVGQNGMVCGNFKQTWAHYRSEKNAGIRKHTTATYGTAPRVWRADAIPKPLRGRRDDARNGEGGNITQTTNVRYLWIPRDNTDFEPISECFEPSRNSGIVKSRDKCGTSKLKFENIVCKDLEKPG